MKTVKLNNGIEMPILGLGVYQITDPSECEKVVNEAIQIGYRLFDTASAYRNETSLGNAIANSKVPRSEFFLTSKVWIQDAGYEKTLVAFEKTLENLQTDYLDLYLIHQPYGDIFGSWKAMQELYQKGKIRAIGVCNFQPYRLMDLIVNSGFTPVLNQIETHPFHQQVESEKFLKDHTIQMQAWGPFAEGRNNLFQNKLLFEIGQKYNKTVAQIVLRWLVQRDIVAIPKSVKIERLKENFDVFDFSLSNDDMELIRTLDEKNSLFLIHDNPEIVKNLSSYKFF